MLEKRQGSRLPHWRMPGAMYFVTFRLADSLPHHVAKRLMQEHEAMARTRERLLGRPLNPVERLELGWGHNIRFDRLLDKGEGSCLFRDPRWRELVENTLLDDPKEGCALAVVMPNHVHALVSPTADLSEVLKRWKGSTSRRLNQATASQGQLWQKESYDRIVRHRDEYERLAEYIRQNPLKARCHGTPLIDGAEPKWDGIHWFYGETER